MLVIAAAVKYTSTFASQREVVITPEQPLKPATTYRVRVHLNKMVAPQDKLGTYEFQFNVIEPDFDIKLAGLTATSGNARDMSLAGILTTADVEESERVEKMVSAKLGGKDREVNWQHASDGRRH